MNDFSIKKGDISSCFNDDRIRLINKKVIKRVTLSQKNNVAISYDIHLDTNVVSEIDKYVREKKQDIELKEAVEAIISRRKLHSSMSIDPYIAENTLLKDGLDSVVKNVIFNFFSVLNNSHEDNIVKARKMTKNNVKQLEEFYSKEFPNALPFVIQRQLYKTVYVNLLKMIIINKKHFTVEEKIKELVDFQNRTIYRYCVPEMNIACELFEKGYDFTFFGILQNKREDIIKDIKNMSWDLFHLRNMEFTMSIMRNPKVDFIVPLMFSFDKKFNRLRKITKLRLFINDTKTLQYYPIYEENTVLKYFDEKEMMKYFGIEAKTNRLKNVRKVKIDKVIAKLEEELLKQII